MHKSKLIKDLQKEKDNDRSEDIERMLIAKMEPS